MVNTEIFPLRSQYARTPAALTPLGSGNLQAREASGALAETTGERVHAGAARDSFRRCLVRLTKLSLGTKWINSNQ